MIFLSKWVICRFHVNLPGCNSIYNSIGAHFVSNYYRFSNNHGSMENGWIFLEKVRILLKGPIFFIASHDYGFGRVL